MNRPLLLQVLLQAISAKKRAYSSTPVGFPIRNDLRALIQGISKGFPSWERARRTPTYVSGRAMGDFQPKESPNRAHFLTSVLPVLCLRGTRLYPNWRWKNPRQLPVCCWVCPDENPVSTLPIAYSLRTTYLSTSHQSVTIQSKFTRGSLGNHLESCLVHSVQTLCRLWTRFRFIQSSFNVRPCFDSI